MIQYSDEGDYDAPTQEESEAIIDQVEYYLSDEYLAKDKYLLRQIRCKSEGYISIKEWFLTFISRSIFGKFIPIQQQLQ